MSGCIVYLESKDSTSKKLSLLATMPILDCCFNVWSMDFILGLLLYAGFNNIYTYTDKLSKFICLIPCIKGAGKLSAPKYANMFLTHIIHLFILP